MRIVRSAIATLSTLALLLAACVPQPRESTPIPAETTAPADFPAATYRQAASQGKPVFRIDPAASLIVIEARRAGSLSRFGHDHVIASHDAGGYVSPDDKRADLYVALDRLVVDEAALRAEAGFDTQPSDSDKAGTRANMLDKVLDAEKFPYASIAVTGIEPRPMGVRLTVVINLHGVTRTLQAPAQIDTADNEINVTGRLAFDQSDFGITPFSILGGAVAVRDRVDLRFRIRARRML
jgi:polyisoprenoid-binding protein YceI